MPIRLFHRRQKTPEAAAQGVDPRKIRDLALEGRRFLPNSTYVLPKDTQEINRLDFQHYLLRQALKGNYLVPITEPNYILDVGAGTGRWGVEMAQAFPIAHVIGVDLERASVSGPVADNYTFAPGNVLERLPFADNTFDFVHQRLLVAAIPAARWPAVIHELWRVTRPRGWVELVECGIDTFHSGPTTEQFFQWGLEASLTRGLDARVIPTLGQRMLEARFLQVTEKIIGIPVGRWGGRLGKMMEEDLLSGFRGLEALYTQTGTSDDFHALLRKLPAEWELCKTCYLFHVFFGQKPERS